MKGWVLKATIWHILSIIIIALVLIIGCVSKEDIKQQAFQDVLNGLKNNNYPTGMLGGIWYMTPSELRKAFPDLLQAGPETYGRFSTVYDQSAAIQYNFKDGLLLEVAVSFDSANMTLEQAANNFDRIQNLLSLDYGGMPNYVARTLSPTSADYDYRISEKWMGRVGLVHVLSIKDHKPHEYFYLFLGSE